MPDVTLNYQRPVGSSDRLAERLRQRELAKKGSIAMHLVIGLPCLLIGPIVLSAIYFMLAVIWFGAYSYWSLIFWSSVVLVIPLLFWTEIRAHGTYFTDTVREANPDGNNPTNYVLLGELGMLTAFIVNPRLSASGLVELFLFGPRMILEAITSLRRVNALRQVDRGRAVNVLADLLAHSTGSELRVLLHENETLASLLPVVAYLLYYQWVDISKTGDRVWVLSDARSSLLQ